MILLIILVLESNVANMHPGMTLVDLTAAWIRPAGCTEEGLGLRFGDFQSI